MSLNKKKKTELPGWLVYAIVIVPTILLYGTNNIGWGVLWLTFLGFVGFVQHLRHNTLTFMSIPNRLSATGVQDEKKKKIVLPWWLVFLITFVPTALLGYFQLIGWAVAWLMFVGFVGFVRHLQNNTIIFMSVPNEQVESVVKPADQDPDLSLSD